ncbi:5'/3'-nucleotidase SurE [Natronospora cellulosivora (SeqCode)]
MGMKILLTNDDGIYAEGIQALANVLTEKGHEVFLVAPDRERSASGHSITIVNPIRAKEVYIGIDNVLAYQVNGTPADCVKLGLERLIPKVDLVISGINDGVNLAYDVLYSGTVSAAIEAWIMGFNSIAISLDRKGNREFKEAALFIENFISSNDLKLYQEKVLLNINVPDLKLSEIKGVKISRLSKSQYEDVFEERNDPFNNKYYWLTGGISREEKSDDTDIWALINGYISITPLKLDLVNKDLIEEMKNKISL